MSFIYLIFAGALGVFLGSRLAKRRSMAPRSEGEMKEVRQKAKKALGKRTSDRKEKILEFMKEARGDFEMGCNLKEGENKQGLTCDEVEKFLGVSEATARKYLNELESENKIKQVGKRGPGVHYILPN